MGHNTRFYGQSVGQVRPLEGKSRTLVRKCLRSIGLLIHSMVHAQ